YPGTGGRIGSGAAGYMMMGGSGMLGIPPQTGGAPALPPAGGFDAGTDPARDNVMPGMICDRLAAIECAAEAACCSNPGRTLDDCKQTVTTSCSKDALVDSIAAQSAAAYDPNQARIVLMQLEALASMCDPSFASYAASPQGIRSIFRGTIAPNGDCA